MDQNSCEYLRQIFQAHFNTSRVLSTQGRWPVKINKKFAFKGKWVLAEDHRSPQITVPHADSRKNEQRALAGRGKILAQGQARHSEDPTATMAPVGNANLVTTTTSNMGVTKAREASQLQDRWCPLDVFSSRVSNRTGERVRTKEAMKLGTICHFLHYPCLSKEFCCLIFVITIYNVLPPLFP